MAETYMTRAFSKILSGMGPMVRALSIHQPYAHLIVTGQKWVENRTWAMNQAGWLLIHASKTCQRVTSADLAIAKDMAFGAIVGAAHVCACLTPKQIATSYNEYGWLQGHPHIEGPQCIIFDRIVAASHPVAIVGQQGVFQVSRYELDGVEWQNVWSKPL